MVSAKERLNELVKQKREQRRNLTPEQRVELNEQLIREYQQKLKDLRVIICNP